MKLDKIPTYWKWILVIFIAGAIYFTSNGTRTYWQRRKIHQELQIKLNEMKNKNKSLETEIALLKHDPSALDYIARQKLGMMQPGEIEYRFVIDNPSAQEKKQ